MMNKLNTKEYVYWEDLINPYSEKINFSEMTLGDLLPACKKYLSLDSTSIIGDMIIFYSLKQWVDTLPNYGFVTQNEIETHKLYIETLEDLSQKYLVYTTIGPLLEATYSHIFYDWHRKKDPEQIEGYKNDLILQYKVTRDKIESQTISDNKISDVFQVIIELLEVNKYNFSPKQIISVLENHSSLKVTDLLLFAKPYFQCCEFSFPRSRGGEGFGTIGENALQFGNGLISAEQYIDQFLSLASPSHSFFDKSPFFEKIQMYRLEDFVLKEDFSSVSMEVYYINETEMCKNAYRQDQLVNLVLHYYGKGGSDLKNSGIAKSSVQQDNIELLAVSAAGFVGTFQKVFGTVKYSHPDLVKALSNVSSPSPFIDMPQVMDGMHCVYGQIVAPRKNNKVLAYYDTINYSLNGSAYQSKTTLNHSENPYYYDLGVLPQPKSLWLENTELFFTNKALWLKNFKPELNKIIDSSQEKIFLGMVSAATNDTIIRNVGIGDTNYHRLCEVIGTSVVNKCAIGFMEDFTEVYFHEKNSFSSNLPKALFQFRQVLNRHSVPQDFDSLFPLTIRQQYKMCVEAILLESAIEDNQIDTSQILIQEMKLGHLNAYCGVGYVYTRNIESGEAEICGLYSPQSQKLINTQPVSMLKNSMPAIYDQLVDICHSVEITNKSVQKLEFVIENQQLYITHNKKQECSPLVEANLSLSLYKRKLISEQEFVQRIDLKSFNAPNEILVNKLVQDILKVCLVNMEEYSHNIKELHKLTDMTVPKVWMKPDISLSGEKNFDLFSPKRMVLYILKEAQENYSQTFDLEFKEHTLFDNSYNKIKQLVTTKSLFKVKKIV